MTIYGGPNFFYFLFFPFVVPHSTVVLLSTP
jgi:hypothetical protein